MAGFGYEIDFLPVGNGDKSGDAIAVRYGEPGSYKVMVVDGGTKESGQALVDHIKEHYGTTHVDYVVNTHPDADHASGLEVVLEQLTVGEVWVHRPWEYAEEIRHWFKDGRITDHSLAERLKDLLSHAYRLEELATEKGIPVYEPYAGSRIGDFHVLSPTLDWYLELVPQFNKTPEAKTSSLAEALKSYGVRALERVASWVKENWGIETLPEGGETSCENESSVILYGNLAGRGVLLTGDAGIQALGKAADQAMSLGFDLTKGKFIQVPHHGSRRNVSPSILNRIVGSKVAQGTDKTKSAFVSASKKSETHPRRVVTNAFLRRGAGVHQTKGITKRHFHNMPDRAGWETSTPVPFHEQVEGE
ncbi:MAG: MBL fold metallo-hydrolase [Betaproteobacteria bacterium]|nr:MBL fold metallo-hydrolase [Betaproteobacteria bacterium]